MAVVRFRFEFAALPNLGTDFRIEADIRYICRYGCSPWDLLRLLDSGF